ncbi:SusC/RagA family TonB-linked outer membrane protein [Pseudotamlana carrageenivorans]|uniref:SusC/RagA family protein n=1 Tax=Pseudotamlana carrageenivorans TaxID=2069432 RepID=A0A2I7SEL7_9FLAO|nr:TonB-dependent receptor [Tamlana carrageenivorans]AUS04336.1 SusC/RagA family protein [Tamlana carrageenivorans]
MTNFFLSNQVFSFFKGKKFSPYRKAHLALFVGLLLLGAQSVNAQNSTTIKGEVLDGDIGGPLPGVTILVKGTTKGTTTDFDGKYVLPDVDANATLVFSYVGYITHEANISGNSVINVTLKPSLESLDEVIVVGYGTSRKSDLTGSVANVGGEVLEKQSIASVAEALTGRMAGVQVSSPEGSPDSEIQIRVRGGGSLTQDASPLIIVDGFPVNSMSDVSPTDIESLTVLKDASSTAIYGSRGANGVIIITTKSGKEGKIQVNFNAFYGAKTIANTIDVLDPEDFVKWQHEYAMLRDNLQSYEKYFGLWQDQDQYAGVKGNNWQKQIYGQMGEVESRNLSIRGGSEKINFNFNYALYDEKAIMVGSNFKRNNLSFALKNKASDKVDLSMTFRYSDTEINGGGANEQNEVSSADSRLKHSVSYSPIPISGLSTDETDPDITNQLVNPFIAVHDNQRLQLRKNFNLLGSFSWKMTEDLTFKTDLGLDNYNDQDYRFYGKTTYYVTDKTDFPNQPAIEFYDRKRNRFRNANTFNYDFDKILNENHSLKVLVGHEWIFSESNRLSNTVHGLPDFFDIKNAMRLTTQGTPIEIDNFYSPDDKLLSFFGRMNYDFKNRYLLTATFRADASSKFTKENRWGYFPSAAFAWKMSEEAFLDDVSWINTLKLRVSYGEAGNNNIPVGQTVQNFRSSPTLRINNVANFWAPENNLANPDLKWETTITQNLGLDFDLFKGTLSGSIEAYRNITTDLLIRFPTPGTGYDNQYRNMGEVENKGLEGVLNFAAINKENVGLSFAINMSRNINRINSLGVMEDFYDRTNWASSQIGNEYEIAVGGQLGTMVGFKNAGRYEVDDFNYDPVTQEYTLKSGVVNSTDVIGTLRPGSMKLVDVNGDGKVNDDDISVIGNANPDFTGGLTINANAYGFDFTAAFNWSVGNDVYNANKIEFTTANIPNGQYRNLSSIMAEGERWNNIDPNTGQLVTDPTQLAALNENTSMWSPYMARYVFSDWAVEDGSFLRLNNISLGYTVPERFSSQAGLSKLRFYLSANNVFILTNYSGLDPEVSTRRRTPLTPGVDYSPYPKSRQIIFGLNLNF